MITGIPRSIESWVKDEGKAHPNEIPWVKGELPDPSTADRTAIYLAFLVVHVTEAEYADLIASGSSFDRDEVNGELARICRLIPTNMGNTHQWVDETFHPIKHLKVTYYAEFTTINAG